MTWRRGLACMTRVLLHARYRRVPLHVVRVYGVADANSSLWDRGWVVPICIW
jgi:hypothetical protein